MKKIFYTTIIALGFCATNYAQEFSNNAIGLRLGSNDGLGGEISYQRKIGESNRIEADLGLRNSNNTNAFKLAGLYQWVMEIQDNFNWYAGVGGGVGSWKVDSKYGNASGSFFFAAADIGVEYQFEEAPFQISLDYRPELYLNKTYRDGLGNDIALSIRYKFD